MERANQTEEEILEKKLEKTAEKDRRNSEYLEKLDRAFKQLYDGNGQEHDLL